jgi:hypothetical protein
MRCDVEAERASHALDLADLQHAGGIAGIKHDGQPAESRDNLTQEFEALTGNIVLLERHSSDVAARMRKVRDEATANRIASDCKDDGVAAVACFNAATAAP